MEISVVIPVYKNVTEFITNLRSNIPYLKNCEIIVVNDDPSKSIQDKMTEFPQVKLIENTHNLGFGPTVNKGVKNASAEYVMLLNSDVLLLDDSYTKALEQFEDDDMFAVTFAQKEKNGEIVGKNRIYWKNGFLHHSKADKMTTGFTAWAEGGSCIMSKDKFTELGGFDEIYAPFYWEDIDLSYRAWKKGYTIVFDERILVQHHHESTIGVHFSGETIKWTAYRNQLLFIWKNVSNGKLLLSHIFHLKILLLLSLLKGDWSYVTGYIKAFSKLPTVLKKRGKMNFTFSDYEILAKFSE